MSENIVEKDLDDVTGGGRSGGGTKEISQYAMWEAEAKELGYLYYWAEKCPKCKAKSDGWYSTFFMGENPQGPFFVKCFACHHSFVVSKREGLG